MRVLLSALRPAALAALMAAAIVTTQPSAEASGVPHVLTSGAVGNSRQVVLISASSTTATTAVIHWWARYSDGSWHLSSRPAASARVGIHGLSTAKREGDGKTPIGVFPAPLGFGWYGNPGTKLPWRTADANSRWVDDSGSAYYNRWMQAPAAGRWDSAERLRVTPYTYALQIGYNLERKPGKGSAIFMHLATGKATAGCVTGDKGSVIATLRWLNPTLHPVFVIGTQDWINTH